VQYSKLVGPLTFSFFASSNFVNASQFAQKANLYASLSVWGQDNTPAVPEPAMPVLFACGALALAVRVRRQRSR
jgi:hypothetical protein